MPESHTFITHPFPKYRELIIDSSRMAYIKSAISAYLEIDVTRPRQLIRELRNSRGIGLSLFSFLLASIGRAIVADPSVQSYRNLFGRLVIFQDVDIVVPIERDGEEGSLPLLYIIRGANTKDPLQIQKDIVDAKNGNQPDRMSELSFQVKFFLLFPRPIRLLFFRLIKRMPGLFIKTMGSIAVTSVGMFGHSLTWGINASVYTTNIVIGGIRKKPMMIKNKLENRDILHVTVSMNHDLVDGAAGARFAQKLTKLIESAKVLREFIDGPDFPDPAMVETKTLLRD